MMGLRVVIGVTGATGPGSMFESASTDGGWEDAGGAGNAAGQYLLGGTLSTGQILKYSPLLNGGSGGFRPAKDAVGEGGVFDGQTAMVYSLDDGVHGDGCQWKFTWCSYGYVL